MRLDDWFRGMDTGCAHPDDRRRVHRIKLYSLDEGEEDESEGGGGERGQGQGQGQGEERGNEWQGHGSTPGRTRSSREQNLILHTNLGLTVSAVEAEKIERSLQRRLLQAGKLSLVVDLDQTVLHATIDPAVEALAATRNDIHRIVLPETPDQPYFIKLRPHLHVFLESIATLFELHVYTMGSRSYAQAVVRIFDPTGVLFYDRVLSREDSGIVENQTGGGGKKNLKRIFPADDTTVIVIDDRADVWDFCSSLVPVPPYTFFVGAADLNQLWNTRSTPLFSVAASATGIEECARAVIVNDDDNELLIIQQILEQIHRHFFVELRTTGEPPDVKKIIAQTRRSVLQGTSIAFSGIIPRGISPEKFDLWRFAVMFGATCTSDLHSTTTHLVSVRNDTDKVLQAVEMQIPVVRPEWLFECFKSWALLPLDRFLLQNVPKPALAPSIPSRLASDEDWGGHEDKDKQDDATGKDTDTDTNTDDDDDEAFLRRLSDEEDSLSPESSPEGEPSPKRLRSVASDDLDDILDRDLEDL